MTTLTPEQRRLLKIGGEEPLRLLDPDTNQEYVLVKAEKYSQVQAAIGDLDPHEFYPALHRVMRDEGWDDPRMDDYNLSLSFERRTEKRNP